MGLSSRQHDHARHRHGQGRRSDRGKAQACLRRCRDDAARLIFTLALLVSGATADTLRVATYNTELERKGPGLLLRDIRAGKDPQIAAVIAVITQTDPDILVLQGIDHDLNRVTLNAFADALAEAGSNYPHRFAGDTNRGVPTGLDMNGDGKRGTANDAQGYGAFYGEGAMALLSKHPIQVEAVQDFTHTLWTDIPDAQLPMTADGPFPSQQVHRTQRLSSGGHWAVPLTLPDASTVTILTFHATPPVFDTEADYNGLRNHDEIRFWQLYLDGAFGPAPDQRFVIAGDANLDPADSEGRQQAIRSLLSDPRLQDPAPVSAGGNTTDQTHTGDPALDTASFPPPKGPGNLRVDYVLPSADWTVLDSGVHWPADDETVTAASRHRLVWVDLDY
jgi:hypothetical protein